MSLLPSEAYPLLPCPLTCVMLAERADLITIPFIHEHVTARAKILILRNSWSADCKKSHGCLLCHTPLTHAGAGLTRAEHLMRLVVEARPWPPRKIPAPHNVRSGRPIRRVVALR